MLSAMAHDLGRGESVLFGGGSRRGTQYVNDTWVWDGTGLGTAHARQRARSRRGHCMVYELAANRVLLFGGATSTGPFNETWTWDGNAWSQQSSANAPTAREGSSMAYDWARSRAVLFSGRNNSPNDTWNGTAPTGRNSRPRRVRRRAATRP